MGDSICTKRRYLGLGLMVFFICLVYSNSFQTSWHLDDYANILYNQKVQLSNLSPSAIGDSFYAYPPERGRFSRPVACLTFALNWYFGQDRVVGYHIVNLLIHCLAALFLAKTVMLLFSTPMLLDRCRDTDAPYWIALLATLLWAVHPIQTQAVTYIVQRMASLAGLFYIMGLCCFLKGRLSTEFSRKLAWVVGVLCSYLLAMGSKQNSVIFPAALALVEIVFFRPGLFDHRRKRLIFSSAVTAAVLVGVLAILLVSPEAINSVLKGYNTRHFTHFERLLTQFRVLIGYLCQIFYPNPAGLSVDHNVMVSTGWLTPWTTLPSFLIVFGTLWALLFTLPKFPLLSFGGIFFLLSHAVESSILPLEIVFEHRNYIPTMFLFVGLSAGFYHLTTIFREQNRMIFGFLVMGGALIIFFTGMGSFSRNVDWRTEKSLWEDVLSKSPNNSRALHNLAWGYYEPRGEADKALSLYLKSIQMQTHRKSNIGNGLHNIGNIYYNQEEYDKAIDYFGRSLRHNWSNIKSHLRLIHSHMALSQWSKAATAVDKALKLDLRQDDLYSLKGIIKLHQNDPEAALKAFRQVRSHQWVSLAGMGQSMHLLGYQERGAFFLRKAQAMAPRKLFIVLNRLENYLESGQRDKAAAMADRFVAAMPADKVFSRIEKIARDKGNYPLQYQKITPVIEASLKRTLADFKVEADTLISRR